MYEKYTTKKSGEDLHILIKFKQRYKLCFVGFWIPKESVSPDVKHTATQNRKYVFIF